MKLKILALCAALGLSACGSDDGDTASPQMGDNTPPSQDSGGTPPVATGNTGNAFFNETLRLTTTSADTTEPVNIDVVGGISFQDAAPPSNTTEPEPIPAS